MPKKLPIFYSALLLTGVNLLLRLAGTAFQVYVSGRIGAAGVGLLQLVMSVGSLAMIAGVAGIRTATMYLTAEELGRKQPGNVGRVLSGCFLYSILCSGAVSALLFTFANLIAEKWVGDIRTVEALRLFAAFLPAVCLCAVLTGYFTAANSVGTLAVVEVAEQLCAMAVTMAALTLWAGDDAAKACQSVILGSSLGCCLTLVCLVLLRLRQRDPVGPPIPVGSRILQAAAPLALADVAKSGLTTTENLMVPKRLALHAAAADPLAAFGIISGMVFPVMMFPACILYGLAELLIPELARCAAAGSSQRIRYLVRRSLKAAMLYGVVFSGLIFLLAEPLCIRLYQNPQAGQALKWYALLIPMLYCDTLTDAMTKGLGQQKACVRYNILTSAMDIALLYLLLPTLGMQGYYISFLITHLLNFALSLRRLSKISGARILPALPLLTAAAMLASVWGASHLGQPASRAAVYVLLLGCLLCLLQVTGKADLIWVKGLIFQKAKAGHITAL